MEESIEEDCAAITGDSFTDTADFRSGCPQAGGRSAGESHGLEHQHQTTHERGRKGSRPLVADSGK